MSGFGENAPPATPSGGSCIHRVEKKNDGKYMNEVMMM